jgi:hypothetical protein
MTRSLVGARAPFVLLLCAVAVAGCGGGGGGGGGNGRLSKDAYRKQLAKVSAHAAAAHAAIEQGAPKAKTVPQVQTLLRRYAAAEDRLGNEVSALKAPQDAEAANAELARGEHDDAAEIRGVVPKLSKFKSVQQAFGFLQQIGHTKGGGEQDDALAQLKKLGYTTGS